jgi:two-component system sensor kinase FixL
VPNSPIKQYGHRIVTSLFHYFGLPGTLCDAQQFFNTSDETASLPFYRVLPLLELNENLMKKGSSLPFLSINIVRRISDSSGEGMSKLGSLAERVPRAVWQYGLAVVSVAVALGITDWLEPYTTLRTPLFYIAIISSAWFGGMGPGLLAVVLSTLAVGYYFAPGGQTPVLSLDTLPFLLLFSLSGLIACWISVKRRRAEEALKRVRDELEVRVEERTSDLRRASEGLKAEIAERKRGEEALREKANLLDLTHDTIFVRDANNVITFWNRGAERLYGWKREEAVGQISHHLMQTIFPAPLEKIMVELNSTGHWEGELIHTLRDGTQVVVASRWALQLDERGKPIAILETNNDITERKRAEEALHRAQTELAHVTRVATLGEMTASIAHEVNQPLGAVVNNASACLRWLAGQAPNLEEARKSAALIIADGHRASEIISRIRALAKKAPPQKDWLDINETILEVIALARSEAQGNRIALQTQLSDDMPLILGDRIQLQQVILNLIINAIEAMSGVGEGPRELQVSSGKDDSQGALVAVRDSGPGLDPKSLDHLFTAFFTTKPKGMGMGLAISRSIIEAHGGRLWATANQLRGATFRFTLPADGERVS